MSASTLGYKPASQRGFGPYEKHARSKLNQYSVKQRNGATAMRQRIISHGKHKPMPPQAAIVITAFFLKEEMALRKTLIDPLADEASQNDLLLAPLGTIECFDVYQGALVYQRRPDQEAKYLPVRMQPNPVSDVAAFECVNGLPRGTQLQFVGWAATNNTVSKFHTDTNGTVQIVGTCTAINVGPDTIPVMAKVYFDEEPCVSYSHGQKAPYVMEIGQPGSESRNFDNPAKFRPALYGMTDIDMASLTSKASSAFEKTMNKNIAKCFESTIRDVASAVTAFESLLGEAEEAIREITRSKPPSFPLKMYLYVHFFQVCLSHIDKNADECFIEVIAKYITTKVVKQMRDKRIAYNNAIGMRDDTQGTLFSVFDVTRTTGEPKKTFLAFDKAVMKLRDYSMLAIKSWMSDHYVGQSLTTSESGAPLNLNLGFGGGQ